MVFSRTRARRNSRISGSSDSEVAVAPERLQVRLASNLRWRQTRAPQKSCEEIRAMARRDSISRISPSWAWGTEQAATSRPMKPIRPQLKLKYGYVSVQQLPDHSLRLTDCQRLSNGNGDKPATGGIAR